MRELERAVDAVVVGERERLVAELGRARGELLRLRRTVEERVRRVAVQLDVPGEPTVPPEPPSLRLRPLRLPAGKPASGHHSQPNDGR